MEFSARVNVQQPLTNTAKPAVFFTELPIKAAGESLGDFQRRWHSGVARSLT